MINVMRIEQDQLITIVTHTGMSLTYSTDELSSTGLRAAGVKSINLKDDDVVEMTQLIQPEDTILIATQRGAVKRIGFKVLAEAKRAQRGIKLLKELKSKPHRIVGAEVITNPDSIYTLYSNKDSYAGKVSDIHLTEQYTNGSFVVDTDEFGEVNALSISTADTSEEA